MRIPLDERTFAHMTTVTFITIRGPLDVALMPDGTSGYDDLIVNAATVQAGALHLRLADLADIIRSKDAAGRVKDQAVLPELRRRLREVELGRLSARPDVEPLGTTGFSVGADDGPRTRSLPDPGRSS
ncbi:MAG: hypothetical protein ACYDGR_12600 [Candidatus Dormibacteria bacterium]